METHPESRGQELGARGMNAARRQAEGPCQLAAARSLYYINLAPRSSSLSPTPPHPPLPDSGLWTAVHLLCGGNSKLGKYDICTKCCRAAGVSSGHGPPLPGTQSLPAARSDHRGSGSAPLPAPGTRASVEEGKSRYSRRPCGCLTNRCGRGFSFPGQLCSQPTAALAPWLGPRGWQGRTGSHGKGREWWPSCLLSTDLSITLGQIRTSEAYRTMISSNSAPAPVGKKGSLSHISALSPCCPLQNSKCHSSQPGENLPMMGSILTDRKTEALSSNWGHGCLQALSSQVSSALPCPPIPRTKRRGNYLQEVLGWRPGDRQMRLRSR